ncbi:MAG: hypothetical protein ACREQC_06985, partial [Candidatus Binataceae bacterium]
MADEQSAYTGKLRGYEAEVLAFLREFESIQENLRLGEVRPVQAQLVAATGDTFRRFNHEFAPLTPPDDLSQFHRDFVVAIAHLERSLNLFLTAPSPNWTLAFLKSRHSFVRGLYALYDLRGAIPKLAEYFAIAGPTAAAEAPTADVNGAATGFSHHEPAAERGAYSLYVPENYSADRRWPLIICLHGGYGEGYEYIWTWLRSARSRGYILLSPKSLTETWSMTMGSIDTRSVMRMLD